MSEHCIIEGKRCTKCCEVIRLTGEHQARWFMDKNNGASGDMLFIQENWVMIPEETAQRLNPYLLTAREATGPTAYFTCLRRSKEGCSIHKDRPEVCSGYPNYDTPLDRYLEGSPIPEYHSECTLWKEGLIKRLLIAINCK